MRTSSILYSCWECGQRMKMELEVDVDNVRMKVAGRRRCVEDWRNFVVFAFERQGILMEPCSLESQSKEYAVEILVPYFEFMLYIRED